MKLWIILLVLFDVKLIIAHVHCDSRAILRRKTIEEKLKSIYDDDIDDYLNPYISDFSDSTTCTMLSLESNESLNIEGPNLKSIKFKDSSISRVPPNLFKEHPSLQSIYINHCHVSDIDVGAFQGLENLQSLYLQNNNITEFKKGIFNSLKNLTILDISGNQINSIGKASFQGLMNLHKLNISHNKIQNISGNIFESRPNSLGILDLSHNIISTVELQAISNLFSNYIDFDSGSRSPNLLDLSFNKLQSFNFTQLTVDLDELNLDNNNLDTLRGLMNSKKNIAVLKLSNNRLSKFSYTSKSSTTLRYLNLSGNILQDFNISLPTGSIMDTLDVSQNLIETLLSNMFDNMSSLVKLHINNNRLAELPLGLFKNLGNLKILSLSGNRLKRIEFSTFSGLSNLLELDISGNLLTKIDYRTTHAIRKLTTLNIANNQLTTLNPDDITNQCRFLQVIILDGNPWKWNCEYLLNFTTILEMRRVQVVEGSNRYIQNHIGLMCYDSDGPTENPSTVTVTVDDHQLENEINDIRKLYKFEFRNSGFYHYFQNYINHAIPSQKNINPLDDYFNQGFENSSFYRYLNTKFSVALLKTYEGFHNLTETMNLLNLKLSNISQTTLANSVLLNSSQGTSESMIDPLPIWKFDKTIVVDKNKLFLN